MHLDIIFAPRYRDLHKKMDTLVGSQHPNECGDWLIKPARKTNDELIEREWPNIQRIMASLAQKDVTQATIVTQTLVAIRVRIRPRKHYGSWKTYAERYTFSTLSTMLAYVNVYKKH